MDPLKIIKLLCLGVLFIVVVVMPAHIHASTKSGFSCYSTFEEGHYALARSLCEDAAHQGDIFAMTIMGDIYFSGLTGEKKPFQALNWFKLPAQAGLPAAQFKFGLLLNPFYHIKDKEQDVASLVKQLNEHLLHNKTVKDVNAINEKIDYLLHRSIYWLERAAFNDDPNANLYLGRRALIGHYEHKRDEKKALAYLQRALSLGQGAAAELIDGIALNRENFLYQLSRAHLGDSKAQLEVARAYESGIGTQVDHGQYLYWKGKARQAAHH